MDRADRGRQVIRQWKMLRLLESRRGLSVAALHRQIDEPCSTRTIRRDLAALEQAGFPLIEDGGRWRTLSEGDTGAWRLPLQPSQVVALLLAESTLAPLPFGEPLDELRERLELLLTPRQRDACRDLATRLRATPAAAPRIANRELPTAIQRAIADSRVLELDYWSPRSGHSRRTIEPHLFWHAATGLYLVGRDAASGAMRTFAAHRIRTATVLDHHFEPDPTFDPDQYIRHGFGVYHGDSHDITVDFAPGSAYLLRERTYHPSQRLEEQPDGAIRAHWTMAGLPEIARWLLGFGGNATIRAPTELRDMVRELHRLGHEANQEV